VPPPGLHGRSPWPTTATSVASPLS
jgi:hypothetical protein